MEGAGFWGHMPENLAFKQSQLTLNAMAFKAFGPVLYAL